MSSYQYTSSKTSWNGFPVSFFFLLWHVSAWNMILWWDFKSLEVFDMREMNVEVGHNDTGDLIWGMWLRLDWVGVGWVAPSPPKINDHILSNEFLCTPSSVRCISGEMLTYFAGREMGGYVTMYSWGIFGIIMIDDTPKQCFVFVSVGIHFNIIYCTSTKGSLIWGKCSSLFIKLKCNWLISCYWVTSTINVIIKAIQRKREISWA